MKRRMTHKLVSLFVLTLLLAAVTFCISISGSGTEYYVKDPTSFGLPSLQVTEPVRLVSSTDTAWGEANQTKWYAVSGDVTIPNTVTIQGNVCLILLDGCNLVVSGTDDCPGIVYATADTGLCVYAGSTNTSVSGTGKLTAKGGKLDDDEYAYAPGIGGDTVGNFSLYSGHVVAIGGYPEEDEDVPALSAKDINVYGGYLDASTYDPDGNAYIVARNNLTIWNGFVGQNSARVELNCFYYASVSGGEIYVECFIVESETCSLTITGGKIDVQSELTVASQEGNAFCSIYGGEVTVRSGFGIQVMGSSAGILIAGDDTVVNATGDNMCGIGVMAMGPLQDALADILGGTVVASGSDCGICANAISGFGKVHIIGGDVTAKGGNYGIYADGVAPTDINRNEVVISGGTVHAMATAPETAALDQHQGIQVPRGAIIVSDGVVYADAPRSGISAPDFVMAGGEVYAGTQAATNIGICASNVTVTDGVLEVKSGSYGIYADNELHVAPQTPAGAPLLILAGTSENDAVAVYTDRNLDENVNGLSEKNYVRINATVCYADVNDNGIFDADDDTMYSAVQAAINAAGTTPTTIKLLCDVTENVTIPATADITLDLNGYALKADLSSGEPASVITNAGILTIKDTSTAKTGKITGGTGTLGKPTHGGGVKNTGSLTLEGGCITKNSVKGFGGGVHNVGTFTMTGGSITDNLATSTEINGLGGGVFNLGTFIMTGGTISDNTAKNMGGGIYNCGTMTVGGTATITDNVNQYGKASNLYLPSGKTITVQDFNGMVGITTQDAPAVGTPIAFTGANDANVTTFFADNDAYSVIKVGATLYLGIPVAQTVETGEKYVSIYDAVKAAGTTPATIVLLRNVQEDVKIAKKANITIDLCGHVLQGTGTAGVIVNNGTATITDSNPTTNHYYVVGANGLWQWNDAATKTDAVSFTDLTGIPAAGTIICVPGGAITGGSAANGGGVYSTPNKANVSLYLDGVNVIGNRATKYGGGVASIHKINGTDVVYTADFVIDGGRILGNIVESSTTKLIGGGLYLKCVAELKNADVSYNTVAGSANDGRAIAGGIFAAEDATVNEMNNLTVVGNTVLATGNCSRAHGGGIALSCQGNVSLSYSIVRGNRALTSGLESNGTARAIGGGIYVSNENIIFSIDNTVVKDNVVKVETAKNGESARLALGAGIYLSSGELRISDEAVLITGNHAESTYKAQGSGVYVAGNTTFIMTAGKITGNTIKAYIDADVNEEEGAGVIVTYDSSAFTVGGTAVIVSNTDSLGGENNVYLRENAMIHFGNGDDKPQSGMKVGVTMANGIGAVTAKNAMPNANYVIADNSVYEIFDTGVPGALQVYIGKPVAVISETNLRYASLTDAIKAAGTTPTTIKLLCDVEESFTIPAGADITLDLCGHVLDLGGKHILNQGILTIDDSDPDAVHAGTLTDYVGGIITNGNANDSDPILQGIGGAIVVAYNGSDTALTMNAGTIVNCSAVHGGAIFVGEGTTFTMNGGTITHCTAERGGAINNYKGTVTVAGTIAYCTATDFGGAIFNRGDDATVAAVTLNNGAVIKNCAAFGGTDQMGGGIFNKGTLVMNAGAVIENCAAEKGAGVHNDGAVWATFTMNGGTIQNNTAAKNGGGVQNSDKATFVMNGGTITGNVAKESLAGGVFTKGKMTVQGTASIYGNYTGTSTQKASNLAVVKGYPITVASNTGLLYVSVIEKDGSYKVTTGTFTLPTATDYSGAFFADDADNYEVRPYRNANGIACILAGKTPVCEITSEGNYKGNRYDTFKQAVQDATTAATPTTIKLLQPLDLTETYQLPDYTTLVINDQWIETNNYNLFVGKNCVFEAASQRDLKIAFYVVPRNGGDKSYKVKLTKDIVVTETLGVNSGWFTSLVIDGDGHTVTATADDTIKAQSHVFYFDPYKSTKNLTVKNLTIKVGNGFRGGICFDKCATGTFQITLQNVTIEANRTKAPLGDDLTGVTGTLIQNNSNKIMVKQALKLVTDAYCWSAIDLDKDKGDVRLDFTLNASVSVTDLRTDAYKIKEPLVGLSGTSGKQWSVNINSSNVQLLYATKSDLNPNNVEGLRCKNGYDLEIHAHQWTYTANGATITASCAGTKHVCQIMAFATNTSITIKAPASLANDGQIKYATLSDHTLVGDPTISAITYYYKATAKGTYATVTNVLTAGYYKACFTVGEATAYVAFSVDKIAVKEPALVGSLKYNGKMQTIGLVGFQDCMFLESGRLRAINAGTYTATFGLDENYKWASGDGTLKWTIAKGDAVITLDAATDTIVATYGESIVLPQAKSNFGTVVCDKTAADLKNVGTYTVTYSVAGTDNYNGATKTITVTIKPAPVKEKVNEPTVSGKYVYNGTEQKAVITGVADYMTVTGVTAATNAGTYTITYTLDANHVWADGSDGVVTWTIAKADAVIDVDTTAIVKTYGDVWTLPTASSNFGTVACDKTVADLKNVGTYTVTYTVQGTDNYNGDTKILSVTIKPAVTAVDEPTVSGTYTYNGAEQQVTVDGVLACMTVSGITKATNAGTYTITYTLDDNHVWADGSDGVVTWTIAKADAVIDVDTTAIVKTYGDVWTLPTATSNFGTVACSKTVADMANAGTYTVTYTVAGSDNYNGDEKTVSVTINPIAVDEPVVSGTYTYTGAEQKATITDVQDCMTVSGDTAATDAGTYTITYTLDDNHVWADGSDGVVTWTIEKADAAIDVDTTAIVKTYGDVWTLPAASSNFGKVVCDKTVADLKNVGTYTVTYTVQGTDNYNGDTKTITVTINPMAVDEPVVSGEYVYNGTKQKVTVTGVLNCMTVTGTAKAKDAGTYTLTYTLDNNHVWADGSDGVVTWTIAKADAAIDVETTAIVKTYGDVWTLPVAVSTYGDVVCDKTVADMKNAGTYTVTYTVAGTDNYNGDTKTITVTINPLAVKEPVVSGSYVFDGSEKQAVITGAADYMTVSGVDKATAAGTYTLTYTLDNNHVWADGSDGIVTWNVNTVQAQIAVDCTPIVVTYGEKVILPIATSDYGTVVCSKTAADLVDVGSYVVTYTVEGTADYAGQVAILTVVVNPLAVNEPTVKGTYKYDGTPVTIAMNGVQDYMTLDGSLTQSAAGVYTVTYTLDNNHVWAEGSDGVVTYEIKAAAIASEETQQGSDKPAVIVETEDGFGDDIILVVVVVEATATDATEKAQTIVDYDNLPNEDLKLGDDEKLAVVFDVKLYRIVNGVSYEIQPEDIKPGTVLKVKMLIPAYVDVTRVTRLLHVHAADDIEEIPFDASKIDADGYYTIEIDRLSEIAFVALCEDTAAAAEFIHWIILAWLLALIVFVAILWYVCKIRGFKQDGENKPAPYIGFGLHFVGVVVLAFFAVCTLCWILLGVNLLALGLSTALYVKGAKEDADKNQPAKY